MQKVGRTQSRLGALFALVAALLLLLGSSRAAFAAPTAQGEAAPPLLFSDLPTGQSAAGPVFNAAIRSRAGFIRNRYAALNTALLSQKKLTLNLFPDANYFAEFKQMVRSAGVAGASWLGTIPGLPTSEVLITVTDAGYIDGYIHADTRLFTISTATLGVNVIVEVDQNTLSAREQPPKVAPQPSKLAPTFPSRPGNAAAADDGSQVDVMVVWSNNAQTAAGGAANMQAQVTTAINSANTAYANSGITLRVRLVYSGGVNYNDSGDFNTDLDRLTSTNDGYIDQVHALRDTYKADLVSLLINDTTYCGLAWLMGNVSTAFAPQGFSVVSWQCISNYSFQHEMGHNMGSMHDPANAGGGGGAYSYSYGYQNPSNVFRTVMAYNCPSGCPRVNYFSNPNVNYAGYPTGTSTQNNALSINNTAYTVANFRVANTARPDTIGIYRPSNNTFYLRNSNTNGTADIVASFGSGPNVYPIVGDWNGDNVDTIGIYDRSTGLFQLRNSNSTGPAEIVFALGNPADYPIKGRWVTPMTYDGTGVFRPSNGVLYLKTLNSSGFADYFAILGNPSDVGISGDWDGDGYDGPGVYRPSNATFYLSNNGSPSGIIYGDYAVTFGNTNETPMTGDWTGTGHAGIGIFRTSNGTLYLKNTLSNGYADAYIFYGIAGDLPVAGRWTSGAVPPPILLGGNALNGKPSPAAQPGAKVTTEPGGFE
jgi:hypothetical protein